MTFAKAVVCGGSPSSFIEGNRGKDMTFKKKCTLTATILGLMVIASLTSMRRVVSERPQTPVRPQIPERLQTPVPTTPSRICLLTPMQVYMNVLNPQYVAGLDPSRFPKCIQNNEWQLDTPPCGRVENFPALFKYPCSEKEYEDRKAIHPSLVEA